MIVVEQRRRSEVAQVLGIALSTVDAHLDSLRAKLPDHRENRSMPPLMPLFAAFWALIGAHLQEFGELEASLTSWYVLPHKAAG